MRAVGVVGGGGVLAQDACGWVGGDGPALGDVGAPPHACTAHSLPLHAELLNRIPAQPPPCLLPPPSTAAPPSLGICVCFLCFRRECEESVLSAAAKELLPCTPCESHFCHP